MPISARVLADSIAPTGKRLTTLEATYPRCIHSEIMTHRIASKNSASSRAIPTEKLIQRVIDDPFVPVYIGANQKGMQAGADLDETAQRLVREKWLAQRDHSAETARDLVALGAHKQVVNRLVEPWMWITIIISSTEWTNWDGLRDHTDAEPHFQALTRAMKAARAASTPRLLQPGEWHLPLVDIDASDTEALDKFAASHVDAELFALAPRLAVRIMVSAGRCARVSYLTHDGRRAIDEDIALYRRLAVQQPLHSSPTEHAAQAMAYPEWFEANFSALDLHDQPLDALKERWADLVERGVDSFERIALSALMTEMRSGNFWGWKQLRKFLPNEHIGGPMP